MYKNFQSTLFTTLRSGKLILMGQNWEEQSMSKSLLLEYTIVYEGKLPNFYPLRLLKGDWKKKNLKYSAYKNLILARRGL